MNGKLGRREFLAATGVTFMMERVGLQAEASDEFQVIPIIDTHQHLWDLQQFRLPWIAKGSVLDHRFSHVEYAKAVEGLNVVQAVYMEVDVDPSQQSKEAEAVVEWCKTGAGLTVAGVISGRPESDDFKAYITPFRDSKYIKGIRRLLQSTETPQGHGIKPEFVRGVRLLGELGLHFDICIPPDRLGDAVQLIDACPGTEFILDHCGCANLMVKDRTPWKRQITAIASRKNVVAKVSGIIATAKRGEWNAELIAPVVNHVLEAFGPDRVMFGGDWPVCTLSATFAEWVNCLKSVVAGRNETEQRKLFAENARRVYGLE